MKSWVSLSLSWVFLCCRMVESSLLILRRCSSCVYVLDVAIWEWLGGGVVVVGTFWYIYRNLFWWFSCSCNTSKLPLGLTLPKYILLSSPLKHNSFTLIPQPSTKLPKGQLIEKANPLLQYYQIFISLCCYTSWDQGLFGQGLSSSSSLSSLSSLPSLFSLSSLSSLTYSEYRMLLS